MPYRRLSKPRTNSATSPGPRPSIDYPKSPKFKTSFEELRNPESRQALREHLNEAFPETSSRRPSTDSVKTVDMPSLSQRFSRRSTNLEVGNNASAKSSSSTVDSVVVGPKRLSMVPEKDNKTVDLEQAIQLLQELKKIASPDELVALHRALLPTKEVETVSSPRVSAFEERAAFSSSLVYQRRSNIPPGLATRGGPGEDILRKPWEATREPQKNNSVQRPARLQHSMTSASLPNKSAFHNTCTSISSLAALDLADETTNPLPARATTPSDWSYANIGGFRSGTLRITNGAASPEPSLRHAISVDQTLAPDARQEDGYFTASEGQPSEDVQLGRASIDVLPRRMSEDSLRVRDRILSSDKAMHQRKQRAQRISNLSTVSRESLVSQMSQTALRVTTKTSTKSFDRESVSPVSDGPTPRWGSRQSHRASEISAEYASDCEILASPYEDSNKNALQAFAQRLSTVYDSDGDDMDATEGTRAATLSKLTGHEEEAPEEELAITPVRVNHSQEPTAEQSDDPDVIRPPAPRKSDSGYGSDSSFMRRKTSIEMQRYDGPLRKTFLASNATLNGLDEKDETVSLTDAQSLYTFEEILSTPNLLTELVNPMPHGAKGKKSLPLLRLHTLKAEKRTPSPLTASSAQTSSDTLPTVVTPESSPGDAKKAQQTAKQQKRLQKPMPPSVKKQRKEEYRKMKQAQSAVELPAVSDNVMAAHNRRLSDQPSMAHLERTYASVGNTSSQEDLDRSQLVEMIGDVQFPKHNASEAEPQPKRPFTRDRSKSRGRGSSSRDVSRDSSPEPQRSWGMARLRSKSGSRTGSQTPKRSSVDMTRSKSTDKVREEEGSSPADDTMPAWTDLGSVASTLGGGSYDISTNQFKRRTAPAAGSNQDALQSPYLISTGLIKAKTSMKGMNSQAAAELARMKSRDIVQPGMVTPQNDRPKIAFPMRRKGKGRSASGGSSPSTRCVEDRFPDWQSKPSTPTSREASPQRPQAFHVRPQSMYAESIPPMPELPADVEVKAIKADEMVAKKLRDSARSTPAASARNSADDTNRQRRSESAKRGVNQQQLKQVDDKTLELLHPTERAGVKQAAGIDVQVRELPGSGSEESSTVGGEDVPLQSLTHEAQHPGWPGWEQQAKAWRQRRESLGAALGKPVDEASVITADSPPVSRKPSHATPPSHALSNSPSIVVSRYITPLGSETEARINARRQRSDLAASHASAYRDLIVTDKENRPAKLARSRTDTAFTTTSTSTSSFVTVKSWDPRPIKQDIPRTDTAGSAVSTDTYHSVQTTTSTFGLARSPGGNHLRTPSGKYVPYSPSKESLAERSRAQSLAKLSGEAYVSSTSLDAPQRRTQFANFSTTSLDTPPSSTRYANASSTSLDTPAASTRHANTSSESLLNRYSGGLNYGWDRQTGFAGSAGTGDSQNAEPRRKSKHMSSEFGLDLSDVPVFLERARF